MIVAPGGLSMNSASPSSVEGSGRPKEVDHVPKVSLADTFDDWDSLLRAAAPHAEKRNLQVYLQELEGLHRRLHEIEALRADLQAQRQRATQELQEVREAGKLGHHPDPRDPQGDLRTRQREPRPVPDPPAPLSSFLTPSPSDPAAPAHVRPRPRAVRL